jgi:hypothetical protein
VLRLSLCHRERRLAGRAGKDLEPDPKTAIIHELTEPETEILMESDRPHDLVMIAREGNQIVALVGCERQQGLAGYGPTIPAALRDLAEKMECFGWESKAMARQGGLFLVPNSERNNSDS